MFAYIVAGVDQARSAKTISSAPAVSLSGPSTPPPDRRPRSETGTLFTVGEAPREPPPSPQAPPHVTVTRSTDAQEIQAKLNHYRQGVSLLLSRGRTTATAPINLTALHHTLALTPMAWTTPEHIVIARLSRTDLYSGLTPKKWLAITAKLRNLIARKILQ